MQVQPAHVWIVYKAIAFYDTSIEKIVTYSCVNTFGSNQLQEYELFPPLF